MEKWRLSETEDKSTDDGALPYVWSDSEEETEPENYNRFIGRPFKGPPIIRPIIPPLDYEQRSPEVNRSIWSRMLVLVKQAVKVLRSYIWK